MINFITYQTDGNKFRNNLSTHHWAYVYEGFFSQIFWGELNPILISNFAQRNSKSHPPHPWASIVHDEIITISPATMLVPIVKIERPRSRTQTLNECELLSGRTNPHLFIFPMRNGILIMEVFLSEKLFYKLLKIEIY
jgi:hypothetical protein